MWQYKPLFIGALSLFLAYAGIQCGGAQSLIANGGFENGMTGWSIWIPDESVGKNCRFDVVTTSPHSGANCVRLQTDDFARFSIGTAGFSAQPGEHYRVTAWVRADSTAQIRPKTGGLPPAAGFVIRLNLRQGNADAAGGHLFLELGNAVSRDAPAAANVTLPLEWTKVESVIEIPPGVDSVLPALFSWWIKGTLFVDDFSIEKVDASAAGTPMPQKDAGSSSPVTSATSPESK